MKIMVTGGAGFIGSHLSRRLLLEQHEVFIIDCLHSYYSLDRKRTNLDEIKKLGAFHFFNIDLLDREGTIRLLKEISPDVVIHLAALPGVAYSIDQPLEYVDYDVKATINVLEGAGKAGTRQVIFASSSSVYGNQEGPFLEEMAIGKVISPYAAAKYSAESFCHVYEHLYGFQMNILRFFTVYGPWGRPDMAIGHFIKKLMNGESIRVFGSGSARDYTYIEDIVEGINLTMMKSKKSETFNIGSGRPITMEHLLSELQIHFPNMVVKREGNRVGDVQQTWADISKAANQLGYQPKVEFSLGLEETVKWAKEYEGSL
ncbi:NAD-dependent epimerase/dehydratase family protein [Robertmurraya sp.]|uniref:NAD-dependent epimerase/dehydratase family protein n=1 Tax=Robertmurraya sp. TaxID=2837525 RepID=UPI003704681D